LMAFAIHECFDNIKFLDPALIADVNFYKRLTEENPLLSLEKKESLRATFYGVYHAK
jgi:hypothetical protein